jgi:beta-galactosidase
MFFERNLPVDVLSSRELPQDAIQRYKLIIVPYPLMLTDDEARILKEYVSAGGHFFVEARAGWVDERGFAQSTVPGFDWDEMLGVRERQLIPEREFEVAWETDRFKGMTFQEQFEVKSSSAHPLASLADGTPIAYENEYHEGKAIIFGSFAGQENYRHPVPMHPLAGVLAKWASLTEPNLRAPTLLELRQMHAPNGRLVFLFNHSQKSAPVEFTRALEKPAASIGEIMTGQNFPATGTKLNLRVEVPAESVRVFRIEFVP